MRIVLILLLLGASAFCGWYFGSPLWTVYRISEAVEAGDADRLSAFVDYPALRRSFGAEFRARLERRPVGSASPLDRLRARLEPALAERAAAALVNPDMVRLMLSARQATAGVRPPVQVEPGRARIVRDSFDRFSIRADNGGVLLFERRGLGWQLAGIALPPELVLPAAPQP